MPIGLWVDTQEMVKEAMREDQGGEKHMVDP